MYRRRYLKALGTVPAVPVGGQKSVDGHTDQTKVLGVSWRRRYDELQLSAVAPAHNDGHVVVARDEVSSDSPNPLQIAMLETDGIIRRQQRINTDMPETSTSAEPDIVQTDAGYAIAAGPWFAHLDSNLTVQATGNSTEYSGNRKTRIAQLPDGFAVAAEVNYPERVRTNVIGFERNGSVRWQRRYDHLELTQLGFLLSGPNGGVVVGGPGPWLASIGPDGTEHWLTTIDDVPRTVGDSATMVDGAVTMFEKSDLVRLTPSRTVEWQRSYDAFGDSFGGEIVHSSDSGYVIASQPSFERLRVGRANATGHLTWSREYRLGQGSSPRLRDLAEVDSGEYVFVGNYASADDGWAIRLSENVSTATPTPEPTPAPTDTNVPSATTNGSVKSQANGTSSDGFGAVETGTALVGGSAILGAVAWLAARRR